MYLTRTEEKMLDGEYGYTIQKCMELLVAIGKVTNAERLIPIKSAHISGVSYRTIGTAGLHLLTRLADGRTNVKVKTTLNPIGMTLKELQSKKRSKFAIKQIGILSAYEKLGVELTCTCTPYLVGNRPLQGDVISWSESSAVVFANSVLGARTNRESGLTALASAIIGKTPLYGLHLSQNRRCTLRIKLEKDIEFGVLGYYLGNVLKSDDIPYFTQIRPTHDDMKSLGAAMNASGSIGMFHIENVTPESEICSDANVDTLTVEKSEIEDVISSYNNPELMVVGCPHLSVTEIKHIARMLKRNKGRKVKNFVIYTSSYIYNQTKKYCEIIERLGGKIICDTCMVVSRICDRYKNIGTNSGKAFVYLRNLHTKNVMFISVNDMLRFV